MNATQDTNSLAATWTDDSLMSDTDNARRNFSRFNRLYTSRTGEMMDIRSITR